MATADQERMVRLHLARQDMEQGLRAGASDSVLSDDNLWDRQAWEQFKAQNGFYPFGWQNGTRVLPPHFDGCPDWAYEAMDLRRTPVGVVRPGTGLE